MKRDVLKTITYGLMHLVVATAVAFAVTGSLTAALSIGLLEPAVQTVFYSLHEKFWGGGVPRCCNWLHGAKALFGPREQGPAAGAA